MKKVMFLYSKAAPFFWQTPSDVFVPPALSEYKPLANLKNVLYDVINERDKCEVKNVPETNVHAGNVHWKIQSVQRNNSIAANAMEHKQVRQVHGV